VTVSFKQSPIDKIQCGALILPAFEGQAPHAAAKGLYDSGEFKGKPGDTVLLHAPAGLGAKRLMLVGCGKPAGADIRKAVATGVRALKSKAIADIAVFADADSVQASTEGALLGEWEPDVHITGADKAEKRFESITIYSAADGATAFARGQIIAESQNFTRDLANEPGNLLQPMDLAARAKAMAAQFGLECEILEQDRMRQLGMGSLLGVAMGSAAPPALIVIRYKPAKPSSDAHLGLIGKGVTFDTGGISIKPAADMDKMKYDMAGAAAVLGAIRAIAQLKPSIAVTAVVPTVENMPGSKALRPGDIVKTLNGKTVEVLNTDAEGRLILNDAITYAQRHLGCTHMVDIATLTGSIVVALGHVRMGAFSNNDELFAKVEAASNEQKEKLWRMPLDDEYKEQLKSAFADLANIGSRWGGSITAAYFLKEFADPTPWVHLDIAGMDNYEESKPHAAKGAAGFCVRTFVDLALNWK
jgi:leucyl aminopeptidase